jgi:formylmethanofuran dehydrogenase subunit B
LCDDLEIEVSAGRILTARNVCPKAAEQFRAASDDRGAGCQIAGQDATLEQSIARAAEILLAAKYPLVWGLGRATVEAQAVAIDIAEQLRGVIDTSCGAKSDTGRLDALQMIGEVSCTLGEMRDRADMIVTWACDPLTELPRLLERHGPRSLADGGPCPLVAIDSRSTATTKSAKHHLRIRSGSEFEAAAVLWALVKSVPLDSRIVEQQTEVSLSAWQSLLVEIEQARYGVMLFAEEAGSFARPLYGFVRALNERSRWSSLQLAKVSNANGAEQVLACRTGFARAVDFSHGFPRFNPADFAAENLLERGEADAALVVCDDTARLSAAAQERLKKMPTVVVDWKKDPDWTGAAVSIPVAIPGVESRGTMFRLDGVPLALRPILAAAKVDLLADVELLETLRTALTTAGGLP